MHRILAALAVLAFSVSAAGAESAGAALYRKKVCTACHGADGSGDTPVGKSLGARDLRSEEVQKKTDGELASTIREGRGKMPSFKSSLSAAEIRQVVAHPRTLARSGESNPP